MKIKKDKTIEMKGESGNVYHFNVVEWGEELVNTGGVYVVMRRNKLGFATLYIGSSSVINAHMINHPLLAAFNTTEATHIVIHDEPSEVLRFVKMRDLIDRYCPDLN